MRNNLITTFTRISSPELTRGVPALEPCRYISNYDKDAQVLLMNSSFRPRLQIIYILGRRRCNFYHNTASRENCNSLPARKISGIPLNKHSLPD